MNASRVVMLCLSVGFGGMIALSCSSGDQVGGYSAFEPAASQQRAQARKEREARKKALAELTAKPDGGKAPEPLTPPPPPPPTPSAVVVADAGPPPVADAAPAASSSGSSAADAGPAPLSGKELCEKLCPRLVTCARKSMSESGLAPGMIDEMVKSIEKECLEECEQEVKKGSDRVAEGQKCLDKPDCDAFMTCMKALRDDD